jgi:hypothetical protein
MTDDAQCLQHLSDWLCRTRELASVKFCLRPISNCLRAWQVVSRICSLVDRIAAPGQNGHGVKLMEAARDVGTGNANHGPLLPLALTPDGEQGTGDILPQLKTPVCGLS